MLTHANFLARFSFEMKVFGYPWNDKKRNLLLLNFHLDDMFRVALGPTNEVQESISRRPFRI